MPQVNRDLVEYGEVESGSTVQGCMCQGFLANRRTLEDASKLFCSNNGNRRNRRSLNYNGFMSHSGLQGAFSSKHSYQPTTPHYYQPATPHSYRPTTPHSYPGVDILALAPIFIVKINKQFDKTWKGIRKIRHFRTVL